jgi:hypothetical protein
MTKRNRNIKNIFIKLQFSTNIMANEVKTPILGNTIDGNIFNRHNDQEKKTLVKKIFFTCMEFIQFKLLCFNLITGACYDFYFFSKYSKNHKGGISIIYTCINYMRGKNETFRLSTHVRLLPLKDKWHDFEFFTKLCEILPKCCKNRSMQTTWNLVPVLQAKK